MHDNDIIIVLTHVPDQNCANTLANALVKAQLAACVNIGIACQSVYEWQGNIEQQTEIPLNIKTVRHAYKQVEALILTLHPYELPDIMTLHVDGGLTTYLQWVNAQVTH